MNSLQLVKYDMYSIIKSPLTYLALLLTIAPLIGFTVLFVQQSDEMNGNILLSAGSWFFSLMGLLFVIKTITRDISQGTLQLYMNKKSNRVGYIIAKVISIILIALIVTTILTAFVLIVQGIVDGENVKTEKFFDLLWFFILFHLFYGLLLYLFALIVPKTALIFTLGIFLVLIVPFAEPFLPMIPKIGDNIQDSLKYVPFSYLTSKTTSSDYTFTHWQWFITVASIVVLFIINLFYVTKKDI
ncbi:phenol-soluble modulin export ABC transporter permease subunit PmtD [Staphylococcus succinus]|uniref:phenol-soluble modulin export ABC transporter permease subunit PmtD n=1 Tax=Staphylococcus succinus TaxID=61015 RepID=UPI00062BCD31|nr:ABC transporter permease subunit [Staphylococcus succinus]MDH9162328.1 ABC transporter permease subunit [Staphylococcus succinus]PNZ21398.1 ABC transporter permease [Staphylococcus succinus subsp. succinus]